ncbi:Heavy metal transport/detoxification protein [Desulfovibrio sp. X2]|uniref:heavy-metal-associated domain-containing protein n=1 Tax=Desulfovibrio sp. X2 TaxID=941449 RepID=UPI0003587F9D|nr:cation transporter [Desulfovibrio sp. X2]EPR42817.1 Heavy metal transport/detoxification protein [Desulfovibrio sp. X2]
MRTIKVKGMSCQHCVASVTEALSKIPGVSQVKVDLASGTATFAEASPVSAATLTQAIEGIGFEVEL